MTVLEQSAFGPQPQFGLQDRIVDATLRCIARWGIAKTTLDDVAREAGCSRATVYRACPGGKDGLIEAVVQHELARFFGALGSRLDAVADQGLEELLVVGMSEAGRRILEHPALQYVLLNEPEAICPHLAFSQMDVVLRTASEFAAPWLARHLPDEEAARLAEWVARILLSYASMPADGVDITDETSIRRLVRTFVLPGIQSNSQGETSS